MEVDLQFNLLSVNDLLMDIKKDFFSAALVESDIVWGNVDINLRRNEEVISAMLDTDEGSGTDLVLLPECFSTGFALTPECIEGADDNRTVRWLMEMSIKKGVAIYTSVPVKEDGRYFNRGMFVLPDGTIGATYDKRHLFMGDEERFYTSGRRVSYVDFRGWRFALNICYDLRFPVWSRNVPDGSGTYYDAMLNVSNWPTSRLDVVEIMTKSRALENQAYMLFCNRVGKDMLTSYSGGSVAVDPKGRLIGKSKDILGTNCVFAQMDRLWINSFRDYFPVLESADTFSLSIE